MHTCTGKKQCVHVCLCVLFTLAGLHMFVWCAPGLWRSEDNLTYCSLGTIYLVYLFFLKILSLVMCMSAYGCVHIEYRCPGRPEVLDSLEMELQVVVSLSGWVLGIRSFARAVYTLNH